MSYMHALRILYMYVILYAHFICMPHRHQLAMVDAKQGNERPSPYMYTLYVYLICMPYMYALYVCLICMHYRHQLGVVDTK